MSSTTLVRFSCDKCGRSEDGNPYAAYTPNNYDSALPNGWRHLRMTNETQKRSGWDICTDCTKKFFEYMEPRK